MRTVYVAALAAGILSAGTNALACTNGMTYCGNTLVNMGWSINEVIRQARNAPEMSHDGYRQSLFRCVDKWYWTNADLDFLAKCDRGCQDNGSGNPDTCK
ncbi:hypothetical protein LZ32DRAFT_611533 [Colletotrichum eremochloae]|nr:hypothetical protein LZ32DRAFT_611533 [Colletotrichum eremochloae]